MRALLTRWGPRALAVGDDAAVLAVPQGERLVVSTDTSVVGVHFREAWMTPAEIGWRATMAALSDLAAMGATPLGMLLALVLPESFLPELNGLADGIGEAAATAGAPILGGDLTRGDQLTIGVTVLGSAASPVPRSGARPGDLVYVTGRLGGSGAALAAFERGGNPSPEDRARFAHPVARIREGLWLRDSGASAMIDISDGLVADLGHMASASGAQIDIELARVPTVFGVDPTAAVASGEEYELALAAPSALNTAQFRERFDLELTPIGRVVEAATPRVRFLRDGILVDLASGYDHFSS